MNTILILGGGVGGVVAANTLRKKIGKEHKILVFDQVKKHVFSPSLLWLMVGKRQRETISRPLDKLSRKGIEFVNGEIEKVDPGEKSVVVNGKNYQGDYLVIPLGAALSDSAELKTAGSDFYTLEGAEAVWNRVSHFKTGKVAVLVTSIPFKCPAAPYEAALLLDAYFRKKKLRDRVVISLYTPEPGPMGVAGKELSDKVRGLVESRNIRYFPGHQYTEIKDGALVFDHPSGKEATKESFDLLAYVPKHECPRVIRKAGLAAPGGWVPVKDRQTMETKFSEVSAISDVTGIPLSLGKPLPKAGVFAHNQAEIVAHNIAVEINDKGQKQQFNGNGECFIEMGGGKAGFARGNFYGEPLPEIKMYKPGYHWHAGKVLFEKDFLRKWF